MLVTANNRKNCLKSTYIEIYYLTDKSLQEEWLLAVDSGDQHHQ